MSSQVLCSKQMGAGTQDLASNKNPAIISNYFITFEKPVHYTSTVTIYNPYTALTLSSMFSLANVLMKGAL